MEGNVFLVDSRYLNKVILAPGQHQVFSNFEEGYDEPETYGIQIVEEPIIEEKPILSNVQMTHLDAVSTVEGGDSHLFMPCLEERNIVVTDTCVQSFRGCDSFVANNKLESNKEVCEQGPASKKSIVRRVSPNLPKKDHNLSIPKLLLSTCYRNTARKPKLNRRKNGYSEERYSIYSGTKSSLRYHGVTDSYIMIPPNLFKRQLADVSDTLRPLLRMPSTRQGMRMLERTVSVLLSQPSTRPASRLARLFTRNCTTSAQDDCIDTKELGLLPVGYQPPFDRSKIKRITRKRKNPDAKQAQLQKMLQLSTGPCDKSGSFSPEYVTIEVPAIEWVMEDDCYFLDGDETSQQIIIVRADGTRAEERRINNMEVLLAAASKSPGELFFCQNSPDPPAHNA